MAKRQRINPHKQGTAEFTLFASYRRNALEAARMQAEADRLAVEAGALRAKAAHYAKALAALGHPPSDAQKLIEGPKPDA